ncbi:tight junction-associated protein 1-like isoform X2 [Mizuhopecten yessoensis]|uniref:tight junction-associated protein 1-like isoform X2 n=1 Tax=Mizuhopecten yessoensis TaxID=6573 RepID=UPI000B459BBF|nr:tight junction-associated protein 1-like isoform X2 [Mizuhopecten yessoensis]
MKPSEGTKPQTMHKRVTSDVSLTMTQACPDCGCTCRGCFSNHSSQNSLDLHQEIEALESQLRKSNNHISQIEHEIIDSKHVAEYEVLKLTEELAKLRDRYDRLYESHKRLQKVNHGLEDKLLKVVNSFEGDKMGLQKEVALLTSKVVEAKSHVCELEEENEQTRKDCNYAVQLLQCKPSNFVAHKLNTLPMDLQERVKSHMTREEIINCEDAPPNNELTKLIRVPMQTFPPTAMVYSINNSSQKSNKDANTNSTDSVPMNLIAKVLTQPESRRKPRRMYICIQCKLDVVVHDKEVQVCMGREINGSNGGTGSSGSLRVHKPSGRIRTSSTETEI